MDLSKVEYVKAEIVDKKDEETVTYVNGTVTWNSIEVVPGTARELTVIVKVKAEATGDLSNGAKIGGETDIPETKNPIIIFEKTSEVTPDLGKENNVSIVKEGSKIIYTIKVKNTGTAEAKNIEVTDTIDTSKVTVEEATITENGHLENGTITWNIESLAGGNTERLLSFTVTVNNQANGAITNTAYVNGTPTNEDTKQYYNPELTSSKTSKIYRDGKEVKDTDSEKVLAKVGDVIKYTITVENRGKVPGKTTVSDTVTQSGVEFVNPENGVTVGDKTYSKSELEAGIDLEVPAQGNKTVVFEVEVKDINGSIKNVATVPGATPENPTDERDTVNIKGEKEVNKDKIKEQEELIYTIKLHNYGSANGTAIVKDSAPEGTTFKPKSIMINEVAHTEYKEADLIKGIEIPVEAGKDAKLSFVVIVNTIKGTATTATIKNTALVDEKPTTPETETTVEKVYVTVTVNKNWEDNEIQKQRRPDKIKFEVYKNTENDVVADHELNIKNGESQYTFNNLPKYNLDGTNVNYTVAEKEVTLGDLKFYVSSSSDTVDALGNKIYNITNRFTRPDDTKIVVVEKIWDDNNNLAGKRPKEVILKLNGTEEIKLTENNARVNDGNTWYKEESKPVYDENGQEIDYTVVEETVPEFYEKSENGTTVTNKFVAPTSETITIKLKKVWDDNNNAAGKRPISIKVTLKATNDSTIENKEEILTGEMTAGEWTKEIVVQKYNLKADLINYIIEENETGSIFYTEVDGEADLTITNKFEVPNTTIPVDVTKIWEDQGNTAGKRPDEITLKIKGSNGTVTDIVLDKVNDKTQLDKMWKETVNLPKYDSKGNEITYSVTEETLPEFYEKSENGTTVTNKFVAPTSETITIKLKKVWDDNNNAAGKRPISIKVTLKATNDSTIENKEEILTGEMTAGEWTKEIVVQKYNSNADLINYVIEENETGSKFYTEIEGVADLTVTNKFEVPDEKADITVKKVWNDNKTTRPDVTFVIKGSNSATNKAEVTLTQRDAKTDGNTWEKEVTTLPKYDENGDEINYTIDEKNVPTGYIKSIDQDTKTITNSLPGIIVEKEAVEVNGEDVRGVKNIGVKLDDIIKYEIKVTNNGKVPLKKVTVTDNIINNPNDTTPSNKQIYLNYDEATGELTNKTNTVVSGEDFAAGETKIYTVYYKVESDDVGVASQSLKNLAIAEGTYTDSNGKDNKIDGKDDATVTIKDAPGLSLVKDKEIWRNGVKQAEGTKVQPGDVIKYTITVTNTGNTILNNVVVTDTMLGREGYSITGGEASLNIGTLERTPNNVAIIHSQYVVQESDMAETEQTITNTATATSTTINSDPDSETVTTKVYKANITVKKESKLIKKSGNEITDKAEYGDTIKYTITATNTGNKAGTIDVTDKVPEGTVLKEKNNDTNLDTTELNALKTETGLTKTLNVPANNGTASIYFEATVIAKPGEAVKNIASVSDGTKPEDGGHDVEKSVKVIKKTETPTITNSNVVIVLDISGSMEGNRLTQAKTASKNFIDKMFNNGATGCAVTVVTFSSDTQKTGSGKHQQTTYVDNAKVIGTATSATEAETLKGTINSLSAGGGTRIAAGISQAKTEIEALAAKYTRNKNIVIVLSDGDFKVGNDGDTLYSSSTGNSTGGETKSRVEKESINLKNSTVNPKVYAVAFGSEAINTQLNLLKDTVASSNATYKTATDDLGSLNSIFTEIGSEITPTPQVPVPSEEAEIQLTKLDTTKNITLRVKTSTATKFTSTEKTVDYYTNLGQIVEKNGIYYLNLKAFNADDEIEIDYFVTK